MQNLTLAINIDCLRKMLMIGLLSLTTSIEASEWFLAPTGSDSSGSGSFERPYRTLTHLLDPALDLVHAHDIITLRGLQGNNLYRENEVRLRVPLTLRSYENEWAVIQCPSDLEDGVCIQIDPSASGSRLTRLEIIGGNLYSVFLQTEWDSRDNKQGKGASQIVLEDCKIHDSGRDVIKITPKSDQAVIRRCEIYRSGVGYPSNTPLDDQNAEGIDNVNGSGMVVEDSYIHDIATTGLYFKGGASDVLIQRNRIERTGLGGILVGFDTSPEFFDTELNPNYYESIRAMVRNNLVSDTDYAGIGLFAALDANILNNTLIHTAHNGHAALYYGVTLQDFDPIAKRPASRNPVIQNNLIIQKDGACAAIRWANEITSEGVSGLVGAPGTDYNGYYHEKGQCHFFDNRPGSALSEGGDLTQWQTQLNTDSHSRETIFKVLRNGALPADSPAINQGNPLSNVTDDIRQQQRVERQDLGAYEVGVNHLAEQVMDWAETNYPNYFPMIKQRGQYLDYRYRYYPSNGNFLAVQGEYIIVHNGRDWQLLAVGTLNDYLPNAGADGF